MVATVYIEEANSTGPIVHTRVDGQVLNDGTDVRFCTTDAVAPVAGNPCIIPGTALTNYSYWKHLFLAIQDTSYTTINNVRFYTDGGIGWNCGTGGGLFVANMATAVNGEGCPMDGSYVQATGTGGTSGLEMIANHTYYAAGSAVNASTYQAGTPLDVDLTDHSAAVSDCKAVVLQVVLKDDATQGTQTDETLTFIYDEI